MDNLGKGFPSELCVTPQRKRTWTPASITNALSAKRRRVSSVSVDLTREFGSVVDNTVTPSPSNVRGVRSAFQ